MTSVDLDAGAVQQAFDKRLNDLCGGEHVYIDDKGKVKDWEDTGHGSGLTLDVKDPTKTQIAALKFRQALSEIRREEYEAKEKGRKKK